MAEPQANWVTDQGISPNPSFSWARTGEHNGLVVGMWTVTGAAYCLVPPNFFDSVSSSSPQGLVDVIANGAHLYGDKDAGRICTMSWAPDPPLGPPDEAGNYRVQANFSVQFEGLQSATIAVVVEFVGTRAGESSSWFTYSVGNGS